MSVRVCVLGSGSKGNSTWIATERTCLLVDAGFSCKETYARLGAIGERPERCSAILISHEHSDHVLGLNRIAFDLKVPLYLTDRTREVVRLRKGIAGVVRFVAGEKFVIGDIEVTPFSVPHDAVDPVAFSFQAEGVKIAIVTDLGYIPEIVRQRIRGCHCLVFESNHDLDMLKVGPYPWPVKQRVMSRHGHLSNYTTAQFLADDFDGEAQILVLAHLSETNNHPEIARLSALEAISPRERINAELHVASQSAPTPLFRF